MKERSKEKFSGQKSIILDLQKTLEKLKSARGPKTIADKLKTSRKNLPKF